MFSTFKKTLALTATASALVVGGFVPNSYAYEQGKTYEYIVLHLNDTHGRFWTSRHGEGGFAAIKTVVDQVRKSNPNTPVILLNGGDFNTGVPESDLQIAKPDIVGMNALGYDAVTVGNHEFDVSFNNMIQQKLELKVPLISANIKYRDPKTGKDYYFYRRYVVVEKDGLKFLIIGNTTPSTKYQSNPLHTKDFTFEDPTEAFLSAKAEAEALYGKPDVILSVTHLGLYFQGKHGDLPYGDYTLAQKLGNQGADAYITGHTHVPGCVNPDGSEVEHYQAGQVCHPPMSAGRPLFQAGKWGRYVGEGIFTFKDGVSTLKEYKLIPINLEVKVKGADGKSTWQLAAPKIEPDPSLKAELQKYQDIGSKQLNVTIGHLDASLYPSRVGQTKEGSFIAEAYRVAANADVSIVNSGGIRDALPAGNVAYRDVLIVNPFHNTLTTVKFNAQQLKDYINQIVYFDDGGRPQFAGITFKVGADHKIYDVKVGGQPLVDGKEYTLTVLSFSANGGDRYPNITKDPTYYDTGYTDAKAIVDYFKAHPNVRVNDIEIQGPGKDFNPQVETH